MKGHGEFQLTRTLSDCHPGNDPGTGAIDAIVSWISRTDVVEEIEGIEAELGGEVLSYLRVLGDGQVGIEERWAIVGVASIIPKLIEERPGKRSRNRSILEHWGNWFEVVPAVVRGAERSEMRRQNAARLVGLAGTVRNIGSALAIARTEGETARPAQIRANLPPADQEIRRLRSAAEELLVAAERQSIDPIELELLFPQIIESSVNHRPVDRGVIVVSVVKRRLPRVPCGELQALAEVLVQCCLQGVVMSVESIVIVRLALRPAELLVVRLGVGSCCWSRLVNPRAPRDSSRALDR